MITAEIEGGSTLYFFSDFYYTDIQLHKCPEIRNVTILRCKCTLLFITLVVTLVELSLDKGKVYKLILL